MKSEFSVGLANKVCAAWDNVGGTPVELNSLVENDALVRGVLAIVRGEAVAKPVQLVAEFAEAPKALPAPFQFKVARTITLGLHKTPAEYRKALKSATIDIGTSADQILEKITISPTHAEVDISEPFTVADLGYTTGTTCYDGIKKRIVELGGELCPNEVGPADRLQNLGQPYGDWYRIAMEPLAVSDGGLGLFSLGRDGDGLYLVSSRGGSVARFGPGGRFVCVVSRQVGS